MFRKLLLLCTLLALVTVSLAACEQPTPAVLRPQPTPLVDTPLPVTMPPLALGTHPNVIYFLTRSSSRTSFNGVLRRYDTMTRQSADVVSMPGVKIEEAQLSHDGQWVLFIAYATDHDELRIVRIDGQRLQTLLVAPPYAGLTAAQWSPNQQFIAFDQQPPQSGPTITYLLDIQHRQLQTELVSGNASQALSYTPRKWLNNTELALVGINNRFGPTQNIYLLDTRKGAGSLEQVSSSSQPCKDFDSNSDGTQLYISSCSSQYNQPASSTITAQSLSGGTPITIFHSSTLAVAHIRFLQPHTLLLLTDSELWTINTDGSGLTRIVAANGQQYQRNFQSFATYSQYAWSNVSRDGSTFALQSDQAGVDTHTSSLETGSFSSGTLTTVASSFVGLVSPGSDVYLVGWTTL